MDLASGSLLHLRPMLLYLRPVLNVCVCVQSVITPDSTLYPKISNLNKEAAK